MNKNSLNKLNTVNRRGFMANIAKTFFGVSIGGSFSTLYANNQITNEQVLHDPKTNGGKAKNVIYLFMSGGLSHLDTFDPKPSASKDIKGKSEMIQGKGDITLGHHLKGIAAQSDSISLVRSMSSTQGAHAQGKYLMRTGFIERASIAHPSTGSWINKLTQNNNSSLPGYITVNCDNNHPREGFFEPELAPFAVNDVRKGLSNVKTPASTSPQEFQRQLKLINQLNKDFNQTFSAGYKKVAAYSKMYEEAVKLMKSEDLDAFDLSKENDTVHKLYGSHQFAKGCLLARRLVEKNVNFIEVNYDGFDWHNDNDAKAEEMLPVMDQAVSALIGDLRQRGLLDSTLIVLTTEFGRSPKFNSNAGRNHHPAAFSCMLAGAGVKGGSVYGKTDNIGKKIEHGKVGAGDLNATIAHSMGLQFDKILYSPTKRPFKISGKNGKPILELFS